MLLYLGKFLLHAFTYDSENESNYVCAIMHLPYVTCQKVAAFFFKNRGHIDSGR